MARKAAAPKPVIPGFRVGTKRSDFRWQAPDGQVWASRFEYQVFLTYKERGFNVRKTGPEDSMDYTSPTRGGICLQCGSSGVAQRRTFTPDLFVDTSDGLVIGGDSKAAGYYIEAKGHLPPDKRGLLRSLRKARPDVDIRFVLQSAGRAGKGTVADWVTKFLKVPVSIYPELP